nr:copper homeostasis protein CutC [Paenibacillus phyllosphaerae]
MLEVIATNIGDVRSAGAYGAHRIELVTGIAEGGLTPSLGLIEQAVEAATIPIQVMVRPHSQSFCYSDGDLAVMRRDIAAIRAAGATGIVLGTLTESGTVDVRALEMLLGAADGLDITFHRAFDEVRDQEAALGALAAYPQIRRILTSGGPQPAPQAIPQLVRLAEAASGTHLRILAGHGLQPETIGAFVQATGVHEVHFGSAVREGASFARPLDAARIGQVLAALELA